MSTRKGADPYVLGHGTLQHEVEHYDLTLTYSVPSNRLQGEAEVTCRAATPLHTLRLDLALRPSKVTVDGRPARKFTWSEGSLAVTLAAELAEGEQVVVGVSYAGNPRPLRKRGLDAAGWEELTDGVIVASQPHGAPSWFPCNDRPSSRSTYRVTVTTAAAYHVAFSGETESVRRSGATRTWTFVQDEPIPAYLASLQIGRYDVVEQSAVVPGGVVPIRVVTPGGLDAQDFAASFGRQPAMMTCFVKAFGPYPFASYTAVITDDPLEIPLEAAALSTFGRNFVDDGHDSVRLVAHEMAHQWFGNSVTASTWADIWLHEGFACYAEWLWWECAGERTAADLARQHHAILARERQPAPLVDPTVQHMFDDWVYKRGALALHALRAEVGDPTFFTILRRWAAEQQGRSVTTPQFVEHCSRVAGRDLEPLLEPWLHRIALPALPR